MRPQALPPSPGKLPKPDPGAGSPAPVPGTAPRNQALGGTRVLDFRFYRSAYEDAAELSNDELVAALNAGKFPADRAYNPTEFLQQVIARNLIPRGFDLVAYQIAHPELWGHERQDWEIVNHYLRTGASAASWVRPFDPAFYRAVYHPDADPNDPLWLKQAWRSNPDTYGTPDEALVRNGWRTSLWLGSFNARSYSVYNALTEQIRTPTQALVHFLERGFRQLLPLSEEHEFDVAALSSLVSADRPVEPAELYRAWIEQGLPKAPWATDEQRLRSMGLDLCAYPAGFDWQMYLLERPDAGAAARRQGRPADRWDAFEHLVEHGLFDRRMGAPIGADTLPAILLAAGDRFAIERRERQASFCYDQALLDANPSDRLLRHAADQQLRLGHNARALALYRRVRAGSEPGFWTWCNGAMAASATGEMEEAAEWALGGLRAYPRRTRLMQILLDIQHVRYTRVATRHVNALREGLPDPRFRPALDAILGRLREAAAVQYGPTAPPSPALPGDRLRIVMLSNRDLPQCTFYRVDQKVEQLRALPDVEVRAFAREEGEAFRSAAATADIAIFYRVASNVGVLQCIAACRAMGVHTVYETDDLIFDEAAFPDPLESYDGAITEEQHLGLRVGVGLVRHALECCDSGIASTEKLAVPMRKLVRSGEVVVHRNGFSASLAAAARAAAARTEVPAGTPVTLFYGSGTLAHGADFKRLLAPALTRLMTERPEVRVVLCGHVQAGELVQLFPRRVERVPLISDRDAYLALLMGADVNLAVLEPGVFADCKSEIKWLEAAAFCVPSVVSDVEGFRETLVDGVHVVRVAPQAEAYYQALRGLVADPALRARIGTAARDRALELYAPEVLGPKLADGLRRLVAPAVPEACAQPRRPRVLIANVFFPPQAIGGATRVVRDQAAELLERYADRYEIGVLCGNDDEAEPYHIESYGWRGVPVWSVGCPRQAFMDWLPFDPEMAAPVRDVLERFQPDLVHAHSIQRLSGTALQQVALKKIPYIVTAHDAWWISDHQFLMDEQDHLVMPWDAELYESERNAHTRNESLSRRLQLRRLLDGAAAVTTVSRTFLGIYQRAGVAKAIAVANGLPDLPPKIAVPPVPGRVRLAHLGGMKAHKGYFLLRQALARGRFPGLEMIVINHEMEQGQRQLRVWGATPVTVMGPVAQENVGALYGSFDVLCALSLWPESYGLVTREALHYGKWVLTSSRGAIGEDVVTGKNGWVLDPGDPKALTHVLTEIQDDPGRYTHAPSLRKVGRTVRQQVDEIVALYDRVLG